MWLLKTVYTNMLYSPPCGNNRGVLDRKKQSLYFESKANYNQLRPRPLLTSLHVPAEVFSFSEEATNSFWQQPHPHFRHFSCRILQERYEQYLLSWHKIQCFVVIIMQAPALEPLQTSCTITQLCERLLYKTLTYTVVIISSDLFGFLGG